MDTISSVILTALYLRGAPRPFDPKPALWPRVVTLLRIGNPSLSTAHDLLRDAGLWAEALSLEVPGLLSWAERTWSQGRALTAEDVGYPWAAETGPPAVWVDGEVPSLPFLTVVGSRRVGAEHRSFAHECGKEAVHLGYAVVSGGASGCDREAVRGALSTGSQPCSLEILPYGLRHSSSPSGACRMSVCAPEESFSAGSAMERNALLYSAGQAAVVVHARFKTGGTWHGAMDATRRRLTRLLVKEEPANTAHRALIALGAVPLRSPANLGAALAAPPVQPKLVG